MTDLVSGSELFLGLVNNLAIFIAMIAVYGSLIDHVSAYGGMRRQVIMGFAFGLFAVGCMYTRIPVADGVLVDQRNALIVLSGAFGGPISAAISAGLAAIMRIHLGGQGVFGGIVGLSFAAVAGAMLGRVLGKNLNLVRLAFGSAAAAVMTMPGFLIIGDFQAGVELLNLISLPYGTAIFLGIFLGSLLLAREDRRRRAEVERLETERARMKAMRELEQANKAKSEFLATMSHELRTPLNAILGFSDLLRGPAADSFPKGKLAEYANDIHHSGQLLLSFINDILDISTIEAGRRILDKTRVNLDEVILASMRGVETAAKQRNVSLARRIVGVPPTLYADERGVRQIVLNLLSNAIKFSKPGGTVTVTTTTGAERVIIEVSDNGIGIPADALPTITQPFSRAQTNPHLTAEGTGLGLHIVQSLVALHNGKLAIDSTEGVGTTVAVTLPRHDA